MCVCKCVCVCVCACVCERERWGKIVEGGGGEHASIMLSVLKINMRFTQDFEVSKVLDVNVTSTEQGHPRMTGPEKVRLLPPPPPPHSPMTGHEKVRRLSPQDDRTCKSMSVITPG